MFERLRRNHFLVLGRAGMDLYADPPGCLAEEAARFTSALGGSAANIAAGIVRLGGSASLVTTVSDDAVGRYVCRELSRYGIDLSHVGRAAGDCRTSLAVVETRAENCQSVIYRNGAADFTLAPADVVGPVCESSDCFTRDRALPDLPPGALVALLDTGAYCATMSSTYNARPLAAEVLVDGARFAVVRDRQSYEALHAGQRVPEWLME